MDVKTCQGSTEKSDSQVPPTLSCFPNILKVCAQTFHFQVIKYFSMSLLVVAYDSTA